MKEKKSVEGSARAKGKKLRKKQNNFLDQRLDFIVNMITLQYVSLVVIWFTLHCIFPYLD